VRNIWEQPVQSEEEREGGREGGGGRGGEREREHKKSNGKKKSWVEATLYFVGGEASNYYTVPTLGPPV
jgi:hypothetical protein